jgi:DNA-binding CsgD family transcriptional regulator
VRPASADSFKCTHAYATRWDANVGEAVQGAGQQDEGEGGLERLLDALYGAAVTPARWHRFLEMLSDSLGGGPCALFLDLPGIPRQGLAYDVRFRSHFSVDYNEHLRLLNPFMVPLATAPVGTVIRSTAALPWEELQRTEFFQAVVEPEGLVNRASLIVILHRDADGPTAALSCFVRSAEPTPAELRLMQTLARHLCRAREIHVGRARANAAAGALLAAMDRLLLGVLLVDESGAIIFSNRSAEDLIRGSESLVLAEGRLWARDPSDHESLQTVLLRVARSGSEWGDPMPDEVLSIRGEDGALDLLVTGLRRHPQERELGAEAAAAIFVGGPHPFAQEDSDVLERLYSLTPAEARLARLLVADRSLEEAAEELGIKTSSARTVLKRIFAKTHTGRQASLVRLLMAGPAQLRSDAPR